MRQNSVLKKTLCIIIINLFAFTCLYTFFIYSIKKNYNYSYINNTLLTYSMKTNISNINEILQSSSLNINTEDVILSKDIILNNEVIINSFINKRHYNATVTITMYGNYEPSIKNKINQFIYRNLSYNEYTNIYISQFDEGIVKIQFLTNMPSINIDYIIKNMPENDLFIKHHLEMNNLVKNKVKIAILSNFILILLLQITINLIFFYVIYILKQIRNKYKNLHT